MELMNFLIFLSQLMFIERLLYAGQRALSSWCCQLEVILIRDSCTFLAACYPTVSLKPAPHLPWRGEAARATPPGSLPTPGGLLRLAAAVTLGPDLVFWVDRLEAPGRYELEAPFSSDALG